MKPNTGWKPTVIIQCYEDRQQTLALRKSAPPAMSPVAAASKLHNNLPPPPPPMPAAEANGNSSVELKNGYVQANETNVNNGNSVRAVKFSENGNLNNNIHKFNLNGLSNGKLPTNGFSNSNLNINSTNGFNGKAKISENFKPPNGALKRIPTPDYDTNTIEKLTSHLKLKSNSEEKVEVDSIDSFKMKNPVNTIPKPPSNYFMRPPNGTATMKRIGRPVSITIGEYPSRELRKEPSKLDFLNGEGKTNGETESGQVPIGSKLQSELAMTLSRSNLRKKTEQAKLDNNGNIAVDSNEESDKEPDVNFHKRYGNNIMPTPPPMCIPKVPIVKTNSHPISQHIAMLAGKMAVGNGNDSTAKDGK